MTVRSDVIRRILQAIICLLLFASAVTQAAADLPAVAVAKNSRDNADKNAALEAAERIRSRFEQETFTPDAGEIIHRTVSIGLAQLLPDESPGQFLFRADQAKQTGRNRICSA
jgi:GGDEF domain-containing protein